MEQNRSQDPLEEQWPPLPYEEWQETYATLHMWTQIVGKIRLAQMPWINHSWHVTLYATSRGLTTSPIPHGDRTFQIDFDFIDHELRIVTCDDESQIVRLESRTTADFQAAVRRALAVHRVLNGPPPQPDPPPPEDGDDGEAP